MSLKSILYLFSVPVVLFALDSININSIFKKNKILQARLFYLIITLGLSYLLVNFFYDFFLNTRII
ncbi:MAG: DUF1146 domain-containing protein [Firmicutes bacterium]|nr:DUF1146 domain-containing protein [Bacillota bacterium]